MAEFSVEEIQPEVMGARIKVIGVGGGGSNMVEHLRKVGVFPGVELAVANTDVQHLNSSKVPVRIQLGVGTTKGLGAGMQPEVGKAAADESYEDLLEFFKETNIVFVTAGMGGGTGTGAAPIIARAAKEAGALTISVVTKPFKFEQQKRMRYAEMGLSELREYSDAVVVIPNERLLSIIDKNLGYRDTFRIVDDVLARAVNGMSGIILQHSDSCINVDFADVRRIMSHKGLALLGIGEASGSDAAHEAFRNALESPLLDDISIKGAMGLLTVVYVSPSHPFHAVATAVQELTEGAENAADLDVVVGTMLDDNLQDDQVRVIVIATGFEEGRSKTAAAAESSNANLKLVGQKDMSQKVKQDISIRKKVSGGEYTNEDMLDVPTFIRNQMD